jgi:hypothetical protein
MTARDELEPALTEDPEVARDVGLEMGASVACGVACGVDCEALERAAPLPDGEQGLVAVVPMTTT